jgi:hypothetical protein
MTVFPMRDWRFTALYYNSLGARRPTGLAAKRDAVLSSTRYNNRHIQ